MNAYVSMSSPAILDDSIYFGVGGYPGNFTFDCVNLADGKISWSIPTPATGGLDDCSPVIWNGIVMSEYTVSANANGSLRQPILFGASAVTGQVLWQVNMATGPTLGGEQCTPLTAYNGIVYADPPESGTLYAINATTGAQLWTYITGKDTCNANIYDGNLWISNSAGTIFVLNPVTGAVLNSTNIGVTLNDGDIVFVNQNLILWEMSGQVISMPTSSIYNP